MGRQMLNTFMTYKLGIVFIIDVTWGESVKIYLYIF